MVKYKAPWHAITCTELNETLLSRMAAVMNSPVCYSTVGDHQPTFIASKLFKVKNIDDKGRIIHIGSLEITDNDIIFTYEHFPSEVTRWPLTCIRRYGIGAEGGVFVVETGRRAPNGEGHYAFKTNEAEELVERLDYYTRNRV